MDDNKKEIEQRIQSHWTRLSSGVFRSPALERMDETLDALIMVFERIVANTNIEDLKLDNPNDAYKIGNSFAALYRARVESEKLRVEVESAHEKAAEEIRHEIRLQLKNDPELSGRLAEIIQKSKTKVIEAKAKKAKK